MSTPSPGKGQGQTSHKVDRLDNQGTQMRRSKTGTSGSGSLPKPKPKKRDQDKFVKKLFQDSAKPESFKPTMSTPIPGKGQGQTSYKVDRLDNQSSQMRRHTSEASVLGYLPKTRLQKRDQDKFDKKLLQDSAKPDCVMPLMSTASQTITPGSLRNKVESTIDNHSSSQFCQCILETSDDEPLKPTMSTPSPGKGQGQTSYKVDWIDNKSTKMRRVRSDTSGLGPSTITLLIKSKKRYEDQLDKKLLPDSAKPKAWLKQPELILEDGLLAKDMVDNKRSPLLRRKNSHSYESEKEQVITTSKGVGLTRPISYKSNELSRRALFRMCIKFNRTSPEVKDACEHVRMQILACSRSFKEVWPTYKPSDPDNIVFVVFCEPGSDRNIKLPTSVRDFDIKYRTIGDYNNEDKIFPKDQQLFSKTEQTYQKDLTDILRKMSSHLMKEHSNLNIITASPIKSENHSLKREPCIVFYVRVKGYIPIQEEELPRRLGSYSTDVREEAFVLYSDTDTYTQRLKIGCSIGEDKNNSHFGGSWGTLGAFVDLERGSVGCITSAHALLNETQLFECKNKIKKDYPNAASTIYQPAPLLVPIDDKPPFGRVTSVVYKTGGICEAGVEVGLITITDPSRYPKNGTFPKVAEGFTEANQLNFMSGSVLKELPDKIGQYTFYKYGATTGLTRGAFKLQATAVRTNGTLNVWGNCELHNQIEVVSLEDNTFAKPGDSGALVLLDHNHDLHAIGIVTGGTTDFTKFYVTPIWEVLNALGLPLKLKNLDEQVPMEMDDDTNENASMSSEIADLKSNIEAVQSNFKKEIKTLRHTVDTKFGNMEANVLSVETKVGNVKAKISNVETKIDNVKTNVCNVESKVGNVETKVCNVEKTVCNVETKVNSLGSEMKTELKANLDAIIEAFNKK